MRLPFPTRLLTVLLGVLAVLTVGAAPAAASSIDPTWTTTIEVHKFEQPAQLGEPATGAVQDTSGLTPVAGATFTATLVPGYDMATDEGRAAAASLTPADVAALVRGQPVSSRETTDANGDAALSPLGVGLYYVQEVSTPAGYVASLPFLVALPLTDPDTGADWLTTVHVYPKNAAVAVTLDVLDQDSVTIGDRVSWLSRSDIPTQQAIDGYRVEQRIDPRLHLTGGAPDVAVAMDCASAARARAAACPDLIRDVDYTVTVSPDGTSIIVEFTDTGRAALVDAVLAHPAATVTIGYDTTVLDNGDFRNEAVLSASRATIDGAAAPVSDTAETRWGPLGIVVHEKGRPGTLIAGAGFHLYLSAEDAAADTNRVSVDGVEEWTTDSQGRITIDGLRFSDFVNGLQREPSDPLFRDYFVRISSIPPGWQGESEVLSVQVTSTTVAQLVVVELVRETGSLPVTGGQLSGAGLLAVALLGVGWFLVAAGRRRRRETASS